MEHWWWGPGLSSGVGDARKFGSLSTATVHTKKQYMQSVFVLRLRIIFMYIFIFGKAKCVYELQLTINSIFE